MTSNVKKRGFVFYDRQPELASLKEMYKQTKKKSIFCVIYGRRRIGKTELVNQFLSTVKHSIYLFVENKTDRELLNDLENATAKIIGVKPKFDSWDDFLEYAFGTLGTKKQLVIVFDEFQNFDKINPAFLSKLQKFWDAWHRKSKVFLIVLGSYVGLLKRLFTDKKEPLFGRADYMMKLNAFNAFQTKEFLGKRGNNTTFCVDAYSVFGGIAKYLLYFDLFPDCRSVLDLVDRTFINEPAPLREEGKNILVLEFGSEHKGYFSVLSAIARGRNTTSEIINSTGLKKDTAGKYLHELVNSYGIIQKHYPIESKQSSKSSKYFISDNFYRFWFHFIHHNRSLLESNPSGLQEKIRREFTTFQGRAFEEVCKQFLLIKGNPAGFTLDALGPWWGHSRNVAGERIGVEIDLVGLNKREKKILFVECKWRDRVSAERTLADLRRKAESVAWNRGKRSEYYCIMARSFSKAKRQADLDRETGLFFLDVNDIFL